MAILGVLTIVILTRKMYEDYNGKSNRGIHWRKRLHHR